MNISIAYQGKQESLSLEQGARVKDALERLQINPETVLVGRKSTIIHEREPLQDGDSLDIIRVISGG